MKGRPQLGRTMFAAVTLGTAIMLLAGIMGSNCGRSHSAPVIIVDTTIVRSDSTKTVKKTSKKNKKAAIKQLRPNEDMDNSRNYRDEIVN